MTLPVGIPYGRVTYAAIRGVVDSLEDDDDLPDARPVLGQVTFTALLTDPVALGGADPAQLFIPPQVFRVVDVAGVGRLCDDSGRPRVTLVSNDLRAVAGKPTWRWRADFSLTGVTQARPSVQFDLPADGLVDLTGLTPPTAALVPPLLRGKSAYEVAVDNGFVGDQTAWLRSLIGPPGDAESAITPQQVEQLIDDHATDLTPHPAYDDLPSLRLLFENGLV